MEISTDTIVAIVTAYGRGGIGIVRASGPKAKAIGKAILGSLPEPRTATFCSFLDSSGAIIDQGIALFFPGPNSYTGEDVVEFQGHGGTIVLQQVLKECITLGARLAEPGEFTKRAYLNEKLDLAQAEGVADLIDAATEHAARSAMRSLHGEFSSIINNLVAELTNLRMLTEAMLDFPEEQIDSLDIKSRNYQLKQIRDKLNRTLQTAKQGSLLREGARIALVGQPNVGKSSLINRLSGEQIALVSDLPGTTRDLIRSEIQINGVPFHVIDTAGLRDSEDRIEMMGIELTRQTLFKADLVIYIRDSSQAANSTDTDTLASIPNHIPRLIVYNKIDLLPQNKFNGSTDQLAISAKTGEGIDELKKQILKMVGWDSMESGIFMARERHLEAIKEAESRLFQAATVIEFPELFAEELRLGQLALSKITGKFSADDLLGEIFSRFCIGK